MGNESYIKNIRNLIGKDELAKAVEQLQLLLEKSPKLDEVIAQSARLYDIQKQVRLGVVDLDEANLTQNQIRSGLLELLREIEDNIGGASSHPNKVNLRKEMEDAISTINSKNVIIGSTISVGGNVTLGDTTTITESRTSRLLRLFLYFFVPILAIGAAFLWQRLQKMKTPLLLTISVDNRTPNPELPFEGGVVTLQYGEKSETLPIREEADFKGIPSNFSEEQVFLRFEARGFVPIDTAFMLTASRVTLPIQRDDSFGRIWGTVKDGMGNPLAGVAIRVQDSTAISNTGGTFLFTLPFSKQRKIQRISAFLTGYAPWEYDANVLQGEEIPIILQAKK